MPKSKKTVKRKKQRQFGRVIAANKKMLYTEHMDKLINRIQGVIIAYKELCFHKRGFISEKRKMDLLNMERLLNDLEKQKDKNQHFNLIHIMQQRDVPPHKCLLEHMNAILEGMRTGWWIFHTGNSVLKNTMLGILNNPRFSSRWFDSLQTQELHFLCWKNVTLIKGLCPADITPEQILKREEKLQKYKWQLRNLKEENKKLINEQRSLLKQNKLLKGELARAYSASVSGYLPGIQQLRKRNLHLQAEDQRSPEELRVLKKSINGNVELIAAPSRFNFSLF